VALAQPSSDTTRAFGSIDQPAAVGVGPRFPQSATDALIELDLSTSEVVELDADEEEGGSQGVSGLLGASRDVFVSQVQYNLSSFRFNPRGYRSDYSSVYFNGFSFRDPETGYANYAVWGGLNDVLRNYTTRYGLAPSELSFGNFAGTTTYSTRASGYRKQASASIGASNRTYATRLMATYSTGLMNNGWAFTASASARLANEGFMDGTPYEAYSYFFAAEKKLNANHSVNFTIFGAPIRRGMSSAVVQDVYDMRDYQYNPNWGYQDGEKRSAKIRNTHLPVAMLNYFWTINEKSKLEAGLAVQTGRNGTSALDWFEGNDPRPDYYRKLPRYNDADNPENTTASRPYGSIANLMENEWRSNNTKVTQIDWQALYEGNYAANYGINRADSGWQAMTILKEYRNDQTTLSGYVNYNHHLNRYISLYGGVEGKMYKGSFYQTVLDPLGADYYLNLDKYVLGTDVSPLDPYALSFNDMNESPSQLRKYKGDKFGYDYDIHQNEASAWAEAQVKLNKFDFFVAGTVGYTEFWRDGHMKNARVESTNEGHSYGQSEAQRFVTGGVKANATYKITGRHFLTANAGWQTRPPLFRNSYLQIRYADLALDDKGLELQTEKVYTGDLAYIFRGSSLRIKAAAFYTLAQDLSEVRTFYDENTDNELANKAGALIEYVTYGLNKQYSGVELGVSYKLTSTLTVEAAATHGAYIYASDPNVTKVEDSQVKVGVVEKSYVSGYVLGGTPQTAGTLTLTYRSPKYWFAGATGNIAGNTYIDMYLDRRTLSFIDRVKDPGTNEIDPAMRNQLTEQEKFPWAYTVDVFGGASWRLHGGLLGINGNVQNILNNHYKTGGYEQTRVRQIEGKYKVDAFPSKYYYSFGVNFFVQVYYRF
jgi:hypothetical protein